ncbi:GtrA family protein, partial [Klebsiella pneumoniae]|nr:GtrA family protein [Klebsiella pneumoniae]
FMETLLAVVGCLAHNFSLPPLLTLVSFSAITLTCGFIYSKFIVFRDAK